MPTSIPIFTAAADWRLHMSYVLPAVDHILHSRSGAGIGLAWDWDGPEPDSGLPLVFVELKLGWSR